MLLSGWTSLLVGGFSCLEGIYIRRKKLPNHLVIPIEAANAAHDGQVIGDTLTRWAWTLQSKAGPAGPAMGPHVGIQKTAMNLMGRGVKLLCKRYYEIFLYFLSWSMDTNGMMLPKWRSSYKRDWSHEPVLRPTISMILATLCPVNNRTSQAVCFFQL